MENAGESLKSAALESFFRKSVNSGSKGCGNGRISDNLDHLKRDGVYRGNAMRRALNVYFASLAVH